MNDLFCKYLFWDFDGVLCTYQALSDQCHINQVDYLRSFIISPNQPFSHSRAPVTLQNLILSLDGECQYVLTEETTSIEHAAKVAFVQKWYSNIPESHIIGVAKAEYKVPVMEAIHDTLIAIKREEWRNELMDCDFDLRCEILRERTKAFRKKLVLIEDTIKNISAAEDAGFSALHVTSLMA